MNRFVKYVSAPVAMTALWLSLSASAATMTNTFGFSGPEIFPIDQQITQLHVADLDGDGLNDIIVANNLRSKINLLYNLTGKTNRADAASARKLEINELPPDSRFRIDSIPTDERIAALAVTDLNGDGRPDLVYFGDAKDLVVRYNLGTNGWSEPKRWHFDDGRMDANALATGDLNGDGLTDIVLLGDNGAVYFLAQQKDHTLAEPVKIPYSGTPKAVQITDVDGDGRNDLFFVDFDNAAPFRVRLQNAGGQLGPEMYFKDQPIRAFWLDNLAGDRTNYLVTIMPGHRTRGSLAVHAQAGGTAGRRVQTRPVSDFAAEQNRGGAARRFVGGCGWRRSRGSARG